MPVPGWRLRISLAASIPSRWKFGGMRMSLTTTSGCAALGAGDESVVVLGHADDLDIGVAREHRPHALADDDAVVGEKDGDRPHASSQASGRPPLQGTTTSRGVVPATPSERVPFAGGA